MRIIAGKFKGRRLAAPKGNAVRPTMDSVKESVFSILREQVVDAHVLDLCAGTGSIGIEALSRGAKHVTFVEREPRCIQIIKRNLAACNLTVARGPVPREGYQLATEQHVRLLRCPISKGISQLQRCAQFDIIYLDAPYRAGIYADCLALLAEARLLCATGTLLVEHSKQTCLPATVGELTQHRQKHYGDTVLSFYHAHYTD